MIISHKIKLDPTYKQRRYFASAAGTARFVYNWALAEWNRQYAAGEKPTAAKLKQQFNAIKYEKFPWLKDIHRDAHSRPFENVGSAFSRFFKKLAGRPRFHRKGIQDAFYVANDKMRLSGKRIRLPVIGWVRMAEELRFSGRVMSAIVSRTADRWSVAIQVDVGEHRKERSSDGVVGVDLGITSLATLSSGEKISGVRSLKANLHKLATLQRQHSRKMKGSKNREKSRLRLARLHARIANIRSDCLHKLTTRLCRENQAVAIEDLNVSDMLRNNNLALHIADAGFGEFRRQLEYKAKIFGTRVGLVGRWFASTKTCSRCNHIKDEMDRSDREFRCGNCGLEIDRDVNAALNIRTAGLAGSDAWGEDGSGAVAPAQPATSFVEPRTKPCMRLCTN